MKTNYRTRILIVLLLSIFTLPKSYAQETLSSMKAWSDIAQKPFMADFFKDMFMDLGIVVQETGEKFTVHNNGKDFELKPGVVESDVEFVLPVHLKNVEDLIEHAADGKIDEYESFRILSVLFTPMTAKSLHDPAMVKNTSKWIKFAKNPIHVYLLDPKKESTVAHTLIFLNGEWIVIPGIYGHPQITYKLTPTQALEYQKKVYQVLHSGSKKNWKEFRKWYIQWSKQMAV